MAEDKTYTAVVTFVNGTQRAFEFQPVGDADPTQYFRRISEMNQSGELVLEMEDKLITLVQSGILSIDIEPKPRRIPKNAIRVYRELTD